jgi:hypothetical protein
MVVLAGMNWIRSLYTGDTYLIGCCPSRMIYRQIGDLEEEPSLEATATK